MLKSWGLGMVTAAMLLMASAGLCESLWRDPLRVASSVVAEGKMGVAPGCGVEAGALNPLTLGEAVRLALCNNPQTRQAWANVLASAAGVGSARAAYLPTVDGSVGVRRRYSSEGNSDSPWTASVGLSYLLLDFGGRRATLDAASEALVASDFSRENVAQQVIFTAIQRYFNTYATAAVVEANRASEESARVALDAAATRVRVGVATPSDELSARSAYEQARLNRRSAENQRTIAEGQLANALGLAPDVVIRFPKQVVLREMAPEFDGAVKRLLALAQQRPDVAAAMASARRAEAGVRLARAAGLPSLSVDASVDQNDSFVQSGQNAYGSSVGVNLRFPIFSGFDRTYQVRQAQEQAEAARAGAANTVNDALLEVWTANSNYQTAVETRTMTAALLASAEAAQRLAIGRYRAGVAPLTELLVAESQLASARQQAASADYTWLTSKAELLRSVGALTPEQVRELDSGLQSAVTLPSVRAMAASVSDTMEGE